MAEVGSTMYLWEKQDILGGQIPTRFRAIATRHLFWAFQGTNYLWQSHDSLQSRTSDLIIVSKKKKKKIFSGCCCSRRTDNEMGKKRKAGEMCRSSERNKWNDGIGRRLCYIAFLGTALKRFSKRLEVFEIRGRLYTIKATSLLKTVRIPIDFWRIEDTRSPGNVASLRLCKNSMSTYKTKKIAIKKRQEKKNQCKDRQKKIRKLLNWN